MCLDQPGRTARTGRGPRNLAVATDPTNFSLSRPRRGGRFGIRGVQTVFGNWQRVAGFERVYNFHTLRHTAITNVYRATWGGVSYVHETPGWVYVSGMEGPQPYIRYLPLSIGLRVRRVDDGGRRGGPFIEAGPSLAPAWYRDPDGRSGFAMMGGFQTGAGIRLGAIDGTRTEFGLSYYLAEAFGEEGDAIGRIGRPRETDVTLVTAYVAVGFGD